MSTPAHLLRDVARLVLLFRADGAGAELRRAALRAAVRSARHVTLDLAVDERTLRLNGIAHLGATAEEQALAAALREARLSRLTVRAGAGVRDVAHLAGLVASVGVAEGASGAALVRELDALRLWSVRLRAMPDAESAPPELPAALVGALGLVRAALAQDAVPTAPELDAAATVLAADVAPDAHVPASALLQRAGDAGARALVARLALAGTIAERR